MLRTCLNYYVYLLLKVKDYKDLKQWFKIKAQQQSLILIFKL